MKTLKDFAVDPEPDEPQRWRPLVALGIDQSLSATGWAIVSALSGKPTLLHTGMITTVGNGDGDYEDGLQRGVLIYRGLIEVMDEYKDMLDLVTPEMPAANQRFSKGKREVVFFAIQSVRCALANYDIPVEMRNAQQVKKVLTEKRDAEKKEVKAAVEALLPETQVTKPKPWNYNVTDAAGIALVSLMEN